VLFPHDALAGKRILLLGATGTIGRATVRALLGQGHEVVCFIRPQPDSGATHARSTPLDWPDGVIVRQGDITDPDSLAREGLCGERFDTLISCLASRTGRPRDAWAVDYQAHSDALKLAGQAGIGQMVLLSAICVQKPLLAFQRAKLAFEQALIESGTHLLDRPPDRLLQVAVRPDRPAARGKPFLLFGDGALTACKPISDQDLGASCGLPRRSVSAGQPDPADRRSGPGDHAARAGRAAVRAARQEPARFKQVPVACSMRSSGAGHHGQASCRARDKAEFARIGRYYATESMLVLDPETGRYDADLTPSTGTDTLFDYYAKVLKGEASVERGEHSVF
jgi:divinyl chlorophyllide a 8-vinyl-reductase